MLLHRGVEEAAVPFLGFSPHLPLIRTLYWVLSKEASSTIFLLFVMTQPELYNRL